MPKGKLVISGVCKYGGCGFNEKCSMPGVCVLRQKKEGKDSIKTVMNLIEFPSDSEY